MKIKRHNNLYSWKLFLIVIGLLVVFSMLAALGRSNDKQNDKLFSEKMDESSLVQVNNEPAINFNELLKKYSKNGYTILLTSFDNIIGVSPFTQEKLEEIGSKISTSLKPRDSYVAIVKDGNLVTEKSSADSLVSVLHHNFLISSLGYAKKKQKSATPGIIYIEDVTNDTITLIKGLTRGLHALVYRNDDPYIQETVHYQFDLFADKDTYSAGVKKSAPNMENGLVIQVDEAAFKKIKKKRKEAIDLGLLLSEDDDWVNAKIEYQGKEFKGEVRLKGDWTDHLLHKKKWSYKVKLDDGTIFGTNKFSVQTAAARNYMGEWMFHELLKKENIIALRYNFLPLTVLVKGKDAASSMYNSVGIMAFEEGFTKYLLENNGRKESVILKVDESIGWEDFKKGGRSYANTSLPISAFEMNKILKDSTKYNQFLQARDLLHSYVVSKDANASSIFDLDKFAYWDAVATYTAGTHGHALHNQRFYYNPTTSLLEPVGFDALGYYQVREPFKVQYSFPEDKSYRNLVQQKLYNLMQTSYIDIEQIFLEENYLEASDILASEYPEKTKEIQSLMRERHQQIAGLYTLNHPMDVYLEKIDKDGVVLNVRSVVKLDIEILGLKYKKKNLTQLSEPLLIREGVFQKDTLNILEGAFNTFFDKSSKKTDRSKFQEITIEYRYVGTKEIKSKNVIPYPYYDKDYVEKDIMQKKMDLSHFPFLKVDEGNKTIYFTKREIPWTLSEPLRLEEGYIVTFSAGFEIDISEGGFIISKSPVFFKGEKESPIKIYSSNGKGGGMVVLQNKEKSSIRHTTFDGLKNPQHGKWSVTGAVTFYESAVDLSNVSFKNNTCEDALNIVRSSFSMDSVYFYNTKSDAFDGDFVTGNINNSLFEKLGNDGIDVSGSNIVMNNIEVNEAGDKAISIGEKSTATIENTRIARSAIGVNTKDLSTTDIEGLEIRDTRLAFTAFQKKEEYGAGIIVANNVLAKGVDELYLIEENSSMVYNGKEIMVKIKDVKDKMYGKDYGRKSER